MSPVEAFDYIVIITGRARLTRDEHERVKVALMTLKPLVEQAQQQGGGDSTIMVTQ